MKQSEQYHQLVFGSLGDKLPKLKSKGQNSLSSIVILLMIIIVILAAFQIQNMLKVNKMNVELETVSLKLDSTLKTLNQITANLGAITRLNSEGAHRPEKKFFNFRLLARQEDVEYQATRDGDKLSRIANGDPFEGKVSFKTVDQDLSGLISWSGYSLSIRAQDERHRRLSIELNDGFLSTGTQVKHITENGVKAIWLIDIIDMIVYDVQLKREKS